MTGAVADAFDEVKRFHVFDHDRNEWAMSGASFPDGGCVVSHSHDDDLVEFNDPAVLVDGRESLSLVWEDGERSDLETEAIDIETSEVAARAVLDDLAHRLDVERDRIKIVSLDAPNVVRYFLITPRAEP